jgi:pimeloyl-ACP methyl ester carboxylesterase
MASPKEVWNHIPDSISKQVCTVTYDRAGIGKSEDTSRKRTVPNLVEELRTMLKNEGLDPPYILVAHSMGSYMARYFATYHSEEIQGMLLIDPSPDRLYDQYSATEYRDFEAMGTNSFANATPGENKEWENYLDNRKYVQGRDLPSNFPVIIISASEWNFDRYHAEMLNDHPHSKQIKVDSGHDVHKERPELIIDLIDDLLYP